MASSSPVSFLGTSLAAFGSVLATGTGWYNGDFAALNTVANNGFSLAAVSGNNITHISALVGLTFSPKDNFLGNITAFRLSSGLCQAVNQI